MTKKVTLYLRGGAKVSTNAHDPSEVNQLLTGVRDFWNGKTQHGDITVLGDPTFYVSLAAIDLVEIADHVLEAP